MISCYEDGEAHPAAMGSPLRQSGRLLRSADGGIAFDGLLRVDAMRSRKPNANLLHGCTSRGSKQPSTDSQSHCSNGCIRRTGHAPAFQCHARHNTSSVRPVPDSLLFTAKRPLHHPPFFPDLEPAITALNLHATRLSFSRQSVFLEVLIMCRFSCIVLFSLLLCGTPGIAVAASPAAQAQPASTATVT